MSVLTHLRVYDGYFSSDGKEQCLIIGQDFALKSIRLLLVECSSFCSGNEVSVYITYRYMYWLLHYHTAKTECLISLYLITCMSGL